MNNYRYRREFVKLLILNKIDSFENMSRDLPYCFPFVLRQYDQFFNKMQYCSMNPKIMNELPF